MAMLPQAKELPNKVALVAALLPQVFEWARSANPSQPLTSGVWEGKPDEWSNATKWTPVQRTQLEQSDVISFHNYSWPEDFEAHVTALQRSAPPDSLHGVHGSLRGKHV